MVAGSASHPSHCLQDGDGRAVSKPSPSRSLRSTVPVTRQQECLPNVTRPYPTAATMGVRTDVRKGRRVGTSSPQGHRVGKGSPQDSRVIGQERKGVDETSVIDHRQEVPHLLARSWFAPLTGLAGTGKVVRSHVDGRLLREGPHETEEELEERAQGAGGEARCLLWQLCQTGSVRLDPCQGLARAADGRFQGGLFFPALFGGSGLSRRLPRVFCLRA